MKRKGWLNIIIICGAMTMATQVRTEAEDELDYQMLTRIRDEGLGNSQVMDHASWLTDVYGPRLTGSPAIAQAADWIAKRFEKWGLSRIHRETFPFGDGWSLVRFSAHLVEPQIQTLIGSPRTWTPGTDGTITADVVRVDINSQANIEAYRGKLGQKIVLTQPARDVALLDGTIVGRWTEELLKAAELTPFTQRDPFFHAPRTRRTPMLEPTLQDKIRAFFAAEGVVAQLDRGSDDFMRRGDNQMEWMTQRTDGGTVFIRHGSRDVDPNEGIPSITLAVEHYNRMVRILAKDVPVRVELDVQVQFHEETEKNGFNLIAELPGTDLAHEVVLLGAHLDSYPWATGATDNAAGVAVMMEVMRILKEVGAKPRRTIRIGLWGAEENGLIGSRAYAFAHLIDGDTTSLKPGHEQLSAYYNIDNGTGRIRGIWLQGNFEVEPIFRQWMQPLRDLGVTTIAPRSVRGSDYMTFDNIGIPAFQFMQDRLEYNSRTHHSNMDFYDRLERDALVQMPPVVASFAYNTAMREVKLPRKPLP